MDKARALRAEFMKMAQDWNAVFGPVGASPHLPQYGDVYLDTSQAVAPVYQSMPLSIGAWSGPSFLAKRIMPRSYRDALRVIEATRALPAAGTAGLREGAQVAQFSGQRTAPGWFNRLHQSISPRYRASMARGTGMLSTESGTAAAMRMAKAMKNIGTVGTAAGAPLAILAEDLVNKPKRELAAMEQAKAISRTNPFIRVKGASMNTEIEKNAKAGPSLRLRDIALMGLITSGVGIGVQELVRNLRIAGEKATRKMTMNKNWENLTSAYPEVAKDPKNYEIFRGLSEIAPSLAKHPSLAINLIRNAQNYATTGMDPGTLRALADIQSSITETEFKSLNKGMTPTNMVPMPALRVGGGTI